MVIPKIKACKNGSEFFKSFYELNKKLKPTTSYRSIANKLSWPVSYIPEVINHKRRLTMQRAIEFTQTFPMKTSEVERLIFLTLRDLVDDPFKEVIENKFLSSNKSKPFLSSITSKQHDLFLNLKALKMHQYLLLNQGHISMEELLHQQTGALHLTREDLPLLLNSLQENEIIRKIQTAKYSVLKQELFWGQPLVSSEKPTEGDIQTTLRSEEEYSKNYINFLKKPTGPGSFSSGFVQIPDLLVEEVMDRIFELRDFLFDLSKKTISDPQLKRTDKNAYQFSFHLFPLFKKKMD